VNSNDEFKEAIEKGGFFLCVIGTEQPKHSADKEEKQKRPFAAFARGPIKFRQVHGTAKPRLSA
jgi:hypothetical protein